MRLILLLLIWMVLPSAVAAQSFSSVQRLHRIVHAVHTHELRVAPAAQVTLRDLAIDPRALLTKPPATLHQRIRLPVTATTDLIVTGRLGLFGVSSQLRIRLRF